MTLTAGIDLGGTKIQAVVMDGMNVVGKTRVLTPRTSAKDIVKAMAKTVTDSLAGAGASLTDVVAVGVGCPGTADAITGAITHSPNVVGMEGFRLGPTLSAALANIPVSVDNDVRVAMLGEHVAGAGRPYGNLLGVFLGTGVGGGLVLMGELRRGRGAAGEIGHTVVKDGGRRCGCGRRGCLEAYAGRASIERAARAMSKRTKTVLFDIMADRKRDRLSSGVIAAAMDAGDQLALQLVDEAQWALALSLSSAQNLLDLEAIIIGGGLGDRLGKPFIDRVAVSMQPHLYHNDSPPVMLTTELQDLSGAVGAGLMAAQAHSARTTRKR